MAFSEQQRKSLSAKLKRRHVRTRNFRGETLSYVEGWHVISEANRIFGFDCWDRTTLTPSCIWQAQGNGATAIMYATTVRITVRAGNSSVTREGIGTGFGRSPSPEAAHEMALKAAETDATKRALATFGNPFGLALYDRDQSGVTGRSAEQNSRKATRISRAEERQLSFATPSGAQEAAPTLAKFKELVLARIDEVDDLDGLYAFWERNVQSFRTIRALSAEGQSVIETLIVSLKEKAQSFRSSVPPAPSEIAGPSQALAIPKEKRLRSKVHLDFVRQHPCVVCGRHPTHAHHIRFAQRGSFGLKVSDEFTVPLCALHHDSLHRVGNERSWWTAQGLDPLKIASELWAKSPRLGSGLQADLESSLALLNAPNPTEATR